MREVLQALRAIQELDLDLFRVEAELRRLPEELNRRRSEIDGRIARLDELDLELRGLRTKIKEIEDQTTIDRQRLRKVEGQAAKSRQDAALLAAFQHEMRSIKRIISEAEEEGLGLVERADALSQECEALRAEIAGEEETFAELSANVERELADARRRRDELSAERKSRLTTAIDPDVMSRYQRLVQAREGVALAELEGRVCQGCYMSVPPNIFVRLSRGNELVQCPSCDRILYLSD